MGKSAIEIGRRAVCVTVLLLSLPGAPAPAPAPPVLTGITETNGQPVITFTPYPGAEQFRMLSAPVLGLPYLEFTNGGFAGYTWRGSNVPPSAFFRLGVTPMGSNDLLAAILLNRVAYGPTPDLLDAVRAGGPEAYLASQLAPETVVEGVADTHPHVALIEGRFAGDTTFISSTVTNGPGTANINDLRAWLVLHAVGADRQLLEVLTQFLENHFVTEYSKSIDYFGNFYNNVPNVREWLGAEMERREVFRWRQALLNPACTFHDLLKISAESPAMIVYLDTVGSRANGANIPNENYSRELMELFTMGVDNGYEQSDIVAMSYGWAGWSVEMVGATNAANPFAAKTTTKLDTNSTSVAYTNLVGVWAFNFKSGSHRATNLVLFPGKTVPARFGEPYVSRTYGGNASPGLYQLNLPSRTGTNAIEGGYDILRHLADLPFTQEYLSVKLCRLLVHDDFAHGYDFTDPGLSDEGRLVRACMDAWENGNPRGQIRAVLGAIFQSDLFRSHNAAFQKVKTPLEFAVSALRVLRSSTNGTGQAGSFTASTDGYALVGSNLTARPSGAPLSRMGGMYLFDRDNPDGYPEGAGGWISAGTLAERLRFVQSILIATNFSGKSDAGLNNVTDPVGLLQARLPVAADQRDAAKVADLFVGLIYPGEGRANLDLYRTSAINFLNTNDSGGASPFSGLTVSGVPNSTYDNRVRGMVAMLLTFQRFQEQ
jgi:uncharacterized protein (DUF1800 family)